MRCAPPSNSHKYLFTGNCTIFLKLFYWKAVLLLPFLLKLLFARQCLLIPAPPTHTQKPTHSFHSVFQLNSISHPDCRNHPANEAMWHDAKCTDFISRPKSTALHRLQALCVDATHMETNTYQGKEIIPCFHESETNFLQLYSFFNSFTFHLTEDICKTTNQTSTSFRLCCSLC